MTVNDKLRNNWTQPFISGYNSEILLHELKKLEQSVTRGRDSYTEHPEMSHCTTTFGNSLPILGHSRINPCQYVTFSNF
jgi:DNA-binding HxlR family transcriptional regulator